VPTFNPDIPARQNSVPQILPDIPFDLSPEIQNLLHEMKVNIEQLYATINASNIDMATKEKTFKPRFKTEASVNAAYGELYVERNTTDGFLYLIFRDPVTGTTYAWLPDYSG
jgi:hypothetical protein